MPSTRSISEAVPARQR